MILFDTDISLGTPGAEIDDGAALMALLRAAPERVAGVTTVHGNSSQENVGHNTRRLLAYLDRADIPLGLGAAEALVEKKQWFRPWQAGYDETPAWPDADSSPAKRSFDAASLIIETIRARPGQVTIVAVGPLTNLALVVRQAPDIVAQVRGLVTMGGSFSDDPKPEFNARCDPEAAAIVLNAGWPVRLLGLELTRQVTFSRDMFASLSDRQPALALLKRQAASWIDRVEAMGWADGGCALHDAVAVAAALQPGLFKWRQARVSVELVGPQRGVTRLLSAADGMPMASVATGVNVDACRAFVWENISSWGNKSFT